MANEIIKICIRWYISGGLEPKNVTPVFYSKLAKVNEAISGRESLLMACISDRVETSR